MKNNLKSKRFWKDYRKDLEPFIDITCLIYLVLTLVVVIFQIKADLSFEPAVMANSGILILLSVFYIFRNKMPVIPKILLIYSVTVFDIVRSLIENGLLSNAFLMIIALVLALSLFFRTNVAAAFSSVLIMGVAIFMWLVHRGVVSYGQATQEKMNLLGMWFPTFLTLIGISAIVIIAIDHFRTRIYKNITGLEKSNELLKKKEEELIALAHYDQLTGMLNKTRFFQILEERESLGHLSRGYIVLCNIKKFRIFNLMLDSERADELLAVIGRIFKAEVGGNDLTARLIGDEFIFWVESKRIDFLLEKISKLKTRINHRAQRKDSGLYLDWHVSAAEYLPGDKIRETFSQADVALQTAKKKDSGDICFFEKGMLKALEKESKLLADLKKAIHEGALAMHYQKQVRIETEDTVGVEALVRWNKEGRILGPGDFLHLVDKNNMTKSFGYKIIETVFRDVPALVDKYGDKISISINISPILFLSFDFTLRIKELAERFDIDPGKIILEFTEDVFIEDSALLQESIDELMSLGFRISLDDFGTGFSSLSYLSHMTLNELKIDRAFIQEITHDKKTLGIVKSIFHIASDLGFQVIAEGIETKEQLDILSGIGCKLVQGYYFSKPEPLELKKEPSWASHCDIIDESAHSV